MGLFTDPVVLNDGVDPARSFSFRAQLSETGSVVGEYIEPAATAAEDSTLTVKHTTSKDGTKRHLLQRSNSMLLPDGVTLSPIVVNFTLSHHPEMVLANVEKQVLLLIDALGEANAVKNLMLELI